MTMEFHNCNHTSLDIVLRFSPSTILVLSVVECCFLFGFSVVVVVVLVVFGLIIGPPLPPLFCFVFLAVEVDIDVVGSSEYSLSHLAW